MDTNEIQGPVEARTKLTSLSTLQTRALAELLTDDEKTRVTIRATFLDFAMSADDALKLLDTARDRYQGDRYSHPYKSTHALVRKLTEERARQQAAPPDPTDIARQLPSGARDALATAAAPSSRHRRLLVDEDRHGFEDVAALNRRGLVVAVGPYGTRPFALTALGVAVREVLAESSEDGESDA